MIFYRRISSLATSSSLPFSGYLSLPDPSSDSELPSTLMEYTELSLLSLLSFLCPLLSSFFRELFKDSDWELFLLFFLELFYLGDEGSVYFFGFVLVHILDDVGQSAFQLSSAHVLVLPDLSPKYLIYSKTIPNSLTIFRLPIVKCHSFLPPEPTLVTITSPIPAEGL